MPLNPYYLCLIPINPNIFYYRNSSLYNPNNTNPNFTRKIVGGPVGADSFVFPADFDNDGNVDVVCASVSNPKALQWYQSSGGFNPTFTPYTINANPGYFGSSVHNAADLDGDGDLDIYGGEFSSIVWYENDLLEPCEISTTSPIPSYVTTPSSTIPAQQSASMVFLMVAPML